MKDDRHIRQVWLDEIISEYLGAIDKFPAMNSEKEAYAIMAEEIDEFWLAARQQPNGHRWKDMRAEAVQIAAMALRFLVDFDYMEG